MNPEDDFYLVLFSNANSELCRFNKPNAFTVIIDQAYKMDGSWDVALWSITLPSRPMKSDPALQGEREPLQTMMVYTDIVTDTAIASRSYPLLALVPIANKNGMYHPMHLSYHRLLQNIELKDISIKLHDISGSPIEFENPDGVVIVELHFKRRTI